MGAFFTKVFVCEKIEAENLRIIYLPRDANVLVHVERNNMLERQLAFCDEFGKASVSIHGRRPSRQTKHKGAFLGWLELIDAFLDVVSWRGEWFRGEEGRRALTQWLLTDPFRHFIIVVSNN